MYFRKTFPPIRYTTALYFRCTPGSVFVIARALPGMQPIYRPGGQNDRRDVFRLLRQYRTIPTVRVRRRGNRL